MDTKNVFDAPTKCLAYVKIISFSWTKSIVSLVKFLSLEHSHLHVEIARTKDLNFTERIIQIFRRPVIYLHSVYVID